MKNPLSRARSRRSDEPVDPAASDATGRDGDGSGVEPTADDVWAVFSPDAPDVSDAALQATPGPVDAPSPVGADEGPLTDDATGAEPADGTDGPSLADRVGRLLGATNRAYVVVAAIALLIGPGAGASAREHLAAAIPRPKAAAVATDSHEADDGTATDGNADEAPTIDDGRRRYLVALAPRATTTTTTTEPDAVGDAPTATTTTTASEVPSPVTPAPGPPPTLPAPPFPVTMLPDEDTQWVDVVRLGGSRVAVLLPVRYLQLVRENDPGRANLPVEAGRVLVRDRDGRYWSTGSDGMDPTLYELAGQLPPPTTPAHEAPSPHAADTSAAHPTAGHENAGAEPATTAHRTTTLPTIARSTTTTLSPAPPALVEPVPLADRDLAIELASLPGVDEVKALGPGVFAVTGTVDPALLQAVLGVASVREDTLWTSAHLRG